jgi:hypothetical protein
LANENFNISNKKSSTPDYSFKFAEASVGTIGEWYQNVVVANVVFAMLFFNHGPDGSMP